MDPGLPPGWVLGLVVPAVHLFGVLSALDAVMHARTPQGSTAWVVALVAMQYLALPSYLAVGLRNGLTQDELAAAITHLAFYAGWPTAVNAVSVARDVFDERGLCTG